MLLHYCPEVKSVEEVVNSEIEEVIWCLSARMALPSQHAAGQQFSAQICRGNDGGETVNLIKLINKC